MDYEKQGLLHEMFTRQASLTPDNVAVISDERSLTFKQLDELSDLLAAKLVSVGVKCDMVVGIYMEKCIEYTIAYIAILKAGGAYMPMDLSYPKPLLDSILSDSKPIAVVTFSRLRQSVQDANNLILLDNGWKDTLKSEGYTLPCTQPDMNLDNLAYTVYSSGTTGKPKGIQCPHRGAVLSYHWRHVAYPYQPSDREASNVFFVWEMLRPLLKGVPMYIVPDTTIYDPVKLVAFLKDNAITRMLFTPSLLEAVLDADLAELNQSLKSMRLIIFCGEVVTTSLLERCMKTTPWIQYINLYSISECHDVASTDLSLFYKTDQMKSRQFCPVGELLPSVNVVILDDQLVPQPVGVSGEIFVSGPTLARGYLNLPDLNEKRFICELAGVAATDGKRYYKTGDWGYVLSGGSLEICGRCDTMVKVRGYSIEVQAVEAALLELSMVTACVVTVEGTEGQDKYLIAYIVPETQTTKKDVRADLKRHLPFYMIPSHFVFLNKIPVLASSGKLDKRALPPPDIKGGHDPDSLPSTATEKTLVDIWAEVLQQQWIDVQESFFDLGGHSLLASKLLGKVCQKFNVKLAVHDLFQNATITALGAVIDATVNKTAVPKSLDVKFELDLNKEVDTHDLAFVNMDIQLRAFWRSVQYSNKNKWFKGHVLLTGSTGFLGSFILTELLLHTETQIYCLVREKPGIEGVTSVKDSLKKFGLIGQNKAQDTLEQFLNNRVTIVKGDVALYNLGMNKDDYNYLLTDINYIIHAAASVNLVYPYQALYGPNVLGTQNVVLFAITSKIKPLHYISTDAVFPNELQDCKEDSDMRQYAAHLKDGYSQTKWVAEQIVLRARDKGLPVAIYRLGNMSGDSTIGSWNPSDFILMILRSCIKAGCAPDIEWNIEMTPVDFISGVIVQLTQHIMACMGKVFHCTNTNLIKSRWIFEWLKSHGYKINIVPYCEWLEELQKLISQEPDNSYVQKLLESTKSWGPEYLCNLSTYDNSCFQTALTTLGRMYPTVNRKLLTTYFKSLADQGIIPLARKSFQMEKRPLDGKVAIVTGASSGIGEAIAKHLVSAGARVSLAARRVDKLKELQTYIEKEGGCAITVATDVTNREQVIELVKHTETTMGPVDILVNNAGCFYYSMMKNCAWDEWETQIDINCKGVTHGIGAVLPGMVDRKSGHIINMSSDAGRRGFPGLAVYSGTKFFVEGLSQGLRHEVAKLGVRVTCIQPGDVSTGIHSKSVDEEAKSQYMDTTSKMLSAEDIAKAVVYVVSQPDYVAINEVLIEPREAPI